MSHNDSDPQESEVTPIRALRILVVEDEFLVAALLEEDLRAAGCVVVGPFTNLASAICASRDELCDLAVLDVNLNGEMVYPLADELVERHIPFIFVSGYGLHSVPKEYRTAPRVAKPYHLARLLEQINRVALRS
jgi:two-component system, response regulator PdtaR